ncbi:hypothetical protein TNCV_4605051 [Trichonephila clavipes]|nr:hypothetical protein TNCV_4605051 [Trichonephila clavipes]
MAAVHECLDRTTCKNMKTFISAVVSQSTNVIRKIVESMLLAIISIAFGIIEYVCLSSGKPIGRLRKTCKTSYNSSQLWSTRYFYSYRI